MKKCTTIALLVAGAQAFGWSIWSDPDVTVTSTVTQTHYTCPCSETPKDGDWVHWDPVHSTTDTPVSPLAGDWANWDPSTVSLVSTKTEDWANWDPSTVSPVSTKTGDWANWDPSTVSPVSTETGDWANWDPSTKSPVSTQPEGGPSVAAVWKEWTTSSSLPPYANTTTTSSGQSTTSTTSSTTSSTDLSGPESASGTSTSLSTTSSSTTSSSTTSSSTTSSSTTSSSTTSSSTTSSSTTSSSTTISTTSSTTSTSTSAGLPTQTYDATNVDYQTAILTQHNVHRTNHSAPDLVWSDQMATIAQEIASTCYYAHNISVGGVAYGQNIGAGYQDNQVAAMITNAMYNGEMPNYPEYGVDNPDMTNFSKWGHFSQIVWKATTSVGCYTQYCPNGLANTGSGVSPYFTVCNYSPQGNIDGEYTNVGAPLGEDIVVVIG